MAKTSTKRQQAHPGLEGYGGMDAVLFNAAVELQVAVRDTTGRTPSALQCLKALASYVRAKGTPTNPLVKFLRDYVDDDNVERETARLAEQKRIAATADPGPRRQGNVGSEKVRST